MSNKFSYTRIVTKDLITDSFQGIRNLFGLRLRGYEKMLNRHLKEMIAYVENHYNPAWWRMSVNPLTGGSVMITIYGEKQDE
jgi:hypothetical protein